MNSAAEFEWQGWHGWYGRPFWIAATILGFILWWPVGLAMLVFGCAGRKMMRRAFQGGWQGSAPGQWHNTMNGGGGGGCGWAPWGRQARDRRRWGGGAPSGNQAFDDYRAETLRRLEDEQQEFIDYLERLRRAKDKSEFDQFMAERRRGRPAGNPPGDTV
jgi:hypothetical protein